MPYGTLLSSRPMKGATMATLVKVKLAPPAPGGIDPNYTASLDARESQRNFTIASSMRQIAHIVNTKIIRVALPGDGMDEDQVRKAQDVRQQEWYSNANMPYYSNFMHTPTDAQRLNNPAQMANVQQRQLTIPNTYGQFYAFMHALSAAFGQLS